SNARRLRLALFARSNLRGNKEGLPARRDSSRAWHARGGMAALRQAGFHRDQNRASDRSFISTARGRSPVFPRNSRSAATAFARQERAGTKNSLLFQSISRVSRCPGGQDP